MVAAEFEAFVKGKAFVYARNGQMFGTEVYRAAREVLWLGTDGSCLQGQWFAHAGAICFVYDSSLTGEPSVCAAISAWGADLRAEEPSGAQVIGVQTEMPDLSACAGPKIGA